MKIFLTGGTGFVGSHLVDRLNQEGHEVFALVRKKSKWARYNLKGTPVEGSLNPYGKNDWVETLPDDLDCVVHIAGLVHTHNVDEFYDINTDATKHLIVDLKEKFRELKFMLISSQAAAGPGGENYFRDEEDEPAPVSHYGRSKLEGERVLKETAPSHWNCSIIRPPMVIGPRDPAFLDVFKMVKQGLVLVAGKDGYEREYSFVCVYDLVKCIALCLKHECAGGSMETLFVAHPAKITYKEIINTIKTVEGKEKVITLKLPLILLSIVATIGSLLSRFTPLNFRLTPDKVLEIAEPHWLCSSFKSTKRLGMTYEWDFIKSIKTTYQDYKERGWL